MTTTAMDSQTAPTLDAVPRDPASDELAEVDSAVPEHGESGAERSTALDAPGADGASDDGATGGAADHMAERVAARLDERLGALDRGLTGAVRLAEARDATITKLHDEVQRLRAGELHQAAMPLLRDLIQLHDALASAAAGGAEAARDELEAFRSMVADILYRHNVEEYGAAVGEPLDAKRHRILAGVDTPDPALDRTVAVVARVGFTREERVIRLADVKAYRFRGQ